MEKKYYLRGLGLGIVVTAIIMGIALPHGTKTREMTDDEVIARAKELGMTEDTRLLEPTEEEPEETDAADAQEAPVKKDIAVKAEAEAQKKDTAAADISVQTDTADGTEQKPTVDTPAPVQTTTSATSSKAEPERDTNEMTKQDDDANAESAESEERNTKSITKSITIASGDGSYTVAKKLEEAGVVSSAAAYDTYLCGHGYDKRLRPGTFQIPAGATDEQIAKIVTGQ